jgi:aminopeptidase
MRRVSKAVKRLMTRRMSLGCKELEVTNQWPKADPDWACGGEMKEGKALMLGVYTGDDDKGESVSLTRTTQKYNQFVCNKLLENLRVSGSYPKLGEARVFFNLEPSFAIVTVVGLGHEGYGYNEFEGRDEGKEAIRVAVGAGIRALSQLKIRKLCVECFGHAESAAEGAGLGLWQYQDLKNKKYRKQTPSLSLYDDNDLTGWDIGLIKASAQNMARQLTESPSNLMTPLAFSVAAVENLCKTGVNVEVKVEEWMQEMKMGAFLAVSKGSVEPPIFLEMTYNGCDPCEPPVVLVGKGVTFDSGGLCLKSGEEMSLMRGDMAGAACVMGTLKAVSTLRLPINVKAIIPLCENMPGASASKPGDIVKTMDGKSILVSDTDSEGVLVLSDALCYAQKYKPKFIMDVGTLTKEMSEMMGASATGVFTPNDSLWKTIKAASVHTGDRVWRLPLWRDYKKLITPPGKESDFTNHYQGNGGYTCTSAALLQQFVCQYDWIHLDTYGVSYSEGQVSYLTKGMSGRPTRTMIEFLAQFGAEHCRKAEEKEE